MTVKDYIEKLKDYPEDTEIPVLSKLFSEDIPYMRSEEFYNFMKKLNSKEMNLGEIYNEMCLLGDAQDYYGDNVCHNLWVIIESLQKLPKEMFN